MYSVIPKNFISKSMYGLRVNESQRSLNYGLVCTYGFKYGKCRFFQMTIILICVPSTTTTLTFIQHCKKLTYIHSTMFEMKPFPASNFLWASPICFRALSDGNDYPHVSILSWTQSFHLQTNSTISKRREWER